MAVAFGLLFLVFCYFKKEQISILKKPPILGLTAGMLIAFNYFGFMKGIELTTASNAQIMIQLAPMGFVILSILALGERPNFRQSLGMLTALLGFAFFFWDQILVSVEQIGAFREGNYWIIGAAVSWSFFAYFQKLVLKTYRPQQFNLLIYGVSALCLLPTATLSELTPMQPVHWFLIAFLSLNTIIAYGAFSEALQRIPASHVSMIISVNPLVTLAIMAYLSYLQVSWIKAEPVHWRGYLGALLVVIGVITTVTSRKPLSIAKS